MADTPEQEKKPEPEKAAAPPAAPPAAPKPPAPPAKPKVDPVEEALRREVPSAAAEALSEKFPAGVLQRTSYAGEATVVVARAEIVEILRFLHDDPRCQLTLLTDQTAVDWPKREKRFDVVYHLVSIPTGQRLRVKLQAADGEAVPSATAVHHAAEWHEREIFDLFGIPFEGHPELKRILLPDDWQGHPLRKEYPLEGFPEQHMRLR